MHLISVNNTLSVLPSWNTALNLVLTPGLWWKYGMSVCNWRVSRVYAMLLVPGWCFTINSSLWKIQHTYLTTAVISWLLHLQTTCICVSVTNYFNMFKQQGNLLSFQDMLHNKHFIFHNILLLHNFITSYSNISRSLFVQFCFIVTWKFVPTFKFMW